MQEAACSAVGTMLDDAGAYLVPYIPQMLQHIAEAFNLYQVRC